MRDIATGVTLGGEEFAHAAASRHGFRRQAGRIELKRVHGARRRRQSIASSSTSNTSVALGGMTPPAPRAP